MAYLGLVPSEYSSGPSVRRGAITKAGNPHVRRLLAEPAWAYQGMPRIGRQHAYRQEALPKVVCDIAWKAQLRLTTRFRRLVARGKAKPTVATAIALLGGHTVATASPPLGVSVPYLPARRISIIHIGVQLCRPSLETARLQLTESREILEKAIRPTRVPSGVFHSL